jgi:acetoin utilization deacetylase AcuC-like enzyme
VEAGRAATDHGNVVAGDGRFPSVGQTGGYGIRRGSLAPARAVARAMGLYYRHSASLLHDTGSHPENAERIRALERKLDEAGWPGLEIREAPRAERAMLERAHDPGLIDGIERLCAHGGGMIDMDSVVVEASWEASLRSAGAAAEAAARLLAGEDRFAFCGTRPPGHHAESRRAMGFCLFNNVAVAARHAIAECGASRVLVLDWDVHHGNGTAEIFESDPSVLYASIHQDPLYPGTGHPDEVGTGEGEGFTINLPVPPGTGNDEFLALTAHVVAPVARELDPDLIAISAGFDAHAADPLANCTVDEAGYAAMTAVMRELGAELDAPLLVCLEGGYDVDALASSALATIRALADSAPPPAADPDLVAAERRRLARHWPALAT